MRSLVCATLLLMPLLIATDLFAAENAQSIRARVIDDNAERIPQHTVAPKYPRKARRDRIEGQVQVCFDVNRAGKPRRIAVRRSTHRWFERPSIKAVRASRFKPLADDDPLPAPKMCRTFIFALEPIPI